MLTGVVAPKLKVGSRFAPAGLVAIAAVRATLPVKLPLGVTVIVAVLPVVVQASYGDGAAVIGQCERLGHECGYSDPHRGCLRDCAAIPVTVTA